MTGSGVLTKIVTIAPVTVGVGILRLMVLPGLALPSRIALRRLPSFSSSLVLLTVKVAAREWSARPNRRAAAITTAKATRSARKREILLSATFPRA